MRELNFCEVDLVSGGLGYMPNTPPAAGSCLNPDFAADNADMESDGWGVEAMGIALGMFFMWTQM